MQVRLRSHRLKRITRIRAADDQGAELFGVIGEAQTLGQARFEHFEIVPLRIGRRDQGKVILIMPDQRHFGQDAPAAVREVSQVHAPCFGQTTCDAAPQVFGSPRARQFEA